MTSTFLDVTPLSFGLETVGDVVTVSNLSNTSIPTNKGQELNEQTQFVRALRKDRLVIAQCSS